MPTTFRPCAPDQSLLFPPSPRDWLPEGHLAFFIADTVAALDLQAFYAPYEGDGRRIFGGGRYEDTYERTPDGWRFKRRQFMPSEAPAAESQAGARNESTLAAGPGPIGPASEQRASGVPPKLSAVDYIQIQQLVARYGWALDSGADNGFAYADLYTPDGVFVGTNQGPAGRSYRGREPLAALARGGRRGPLYVSHYATNVVIEPTADGARGHSYVAIFSLGEDGKASAIDHGGRYDDVYAKTPTGWKFKSRTFYEYESKSGDPVDPPPTPLAPLAPLSVQPAGRSAPTRAGGAAPSLTAADYIEIQQLVARYPFALDGDTDNGASYANLFTDDAVFSRPVTTGHGKLAALAVSQPHGPRYTRHFTTNHVIDPAPGGAIGKEYLVVIDIGTPGQSSSVFLMGHYDDTYEETTAGWRFKTRTFVTAKSGSPSGDSPAATGGR